MKKFVPFTTTIPLFLEKKQVLDQNARLLCAISGGQDSILSFFILFHLFSRNLPWPPPRTEKIEFQAEKNSINYLKLPVLKTLSFLDKNLKIANFSKLEVLYCQHFWQPKNFFCSEFLFQISFLVEIQYTIILPQTSLDSENRSRVWRKRNFSRFLQLKKISNIVTGNTKSDRFEKNLTNLLRGTSPHSLSDSIVFNENKLTNVFFSNVILKPKKQEFLSTDTFLNLNNLHSHLKTKKKFHLLLKPQGLSVQKSFVQPTKSHLSKQKKHFDFGKKQVSDFQKKKLFRNTSEALKIKNLSLIKKRRFQIKKFSFFANNLKRAKTDLKNSLFLFHSSVSYSFCLGNKTLNNQIKFFKPLQNLTRFSVSKAVNLFSLPISNDITNFSLNFSRNKIRHYLIPFIRFFFQASIESLLTKFLFLVNIEHEEIENQIFELKMIFKLLRVKKNRRQKSITPLIKNFEFSTLFLNDKKFRETKVTYIKLTVSSERLLLQKCVNHYIEIQLTYSQICQLQTFVSIPNQ